jgi:multiple sugar transport system permease protein
MSTTVMTQPRTWHRGEFPRRVKSLGLVLLACVITGLMLFPFYWMLNVSLMPQTDIIRYPPPFIPVHLTIDAYPTALARGAGESFRSSLIYGLGTVLVTMVIATPAAYGLARMLSGRVGSIFLLVLILAQMNPAIVVGMSLYVTFSQLNLLNSYVAIILADTSYAVPFAIIIMRAFMIGIPRELVEAALVDGAGQWRIFWSIILPLSRTALITASLFAFLYGWGDFLFALILNTDPHLVPITVGIYRFIGLEVNWPAIMATSVIAAIPATLLIVGAQRYIAVGITAGALKE